MDPQQMISWRRYGYRMIGSAADRAELARRRYLGDAALNLAPYKAAEQTGGSLVGESYVPPPAPRKVTISLHLGPVSSAIPIATSAPSAPPAAAPVSAPAPAPTSSPGVAIAAAAAPAPCSCALVGAGAGVAGALLGYLVGLATREKTKRGRR